MIESVDAGAATVEIAAAPATVFAVLSDVRRTPEWSPECVAVDWVGDVGRDGPVAGARFRGTNRAGSREWTMEAVVEAVDAPRRFAFVTERDGRPRTRWSYELEPTGTGTALTERWERLVVPSLPQRIVERLVLRGGRLAHNARNLDASLARIKAICES